VSPRRTSAFARTSATFALALLGAAAAAAPAAAQVTPPQREIIAPPGQRPGGTLSPAVRAGDMVYFSGQIGRGEGAEAIQTATRQAMQSLRGVMELAQVRVDELVKCNVYLVDMTQFSAMNSVYVEFFGDVAPPARTTVAVAALPANAIFEIACIAYAPRR
jgi:2-iminobutanoate/2-iminopropanoate deaminase